MQNESDFMDLIHRKAVLYKCMKDDEISAETGIDLVKEFNEKLKKAKEYVANASR